MVKEIIIGNVKIGGDRPLVLIAGPCVMENEAVTLRTAERLMTICNGISIPLIFKASYDKAMEAMSKLGDEMMKGKTDVKMCGNCQAYGDLMMAGAKFDYVPAKVGDILVITSDKPEMVDKIKKYGQRNREELAKMETTDKPKK